MFKLKHLYRAQCVLTCSILGCLSLNTAYADFWENSQKSIYLRNFFVERDIYGTDQDIGSWSQGITGRFESGYTDTPIQTGLDVGVQSALRLSDHNSSRRDVVFKYDKSGGEQERSYTKIGATLKLKYAKSDLKVGEIFPKLPVMSIDESRQLITTFAGIMYESQDIENLRMSAGRITHMNARDDDKFRKISIASDMNLDKASDGMNYLGLDFKFSPKIAGSYWFGQLEDIYQQHYVNAAYSENVGKSRINVDARYFNFEEDGNANFGKIDAQSVGLQTTIQHGNSSLVAGMQKNMGDTAIPVLTGYVPIPYLQSWSTLGFYKAEEFTWHILYNYDFTEAGVPGLKLGLRYLNGSQIHREGLNDNKENEKNIILSYTVPEGKLKGLGLEWRNIQTDVKYGTEHNMGPKFNENRFITAYTFKF